MLRLLRMCAKHHWGGDGCAFSAYLQGEGPPMTKTELFRRNVQTSRKGETLDPTLRYPQAEAAWEAREPCLRWIPLRDACQISVISCCNSCDVRPFIQDLLMLWPWLRGCVRSRIVRAFLIEEQKCVKQVLAEKLSQAKEKESGGHLDLADDVDGVIWCKEMEHLHAPLSY